LASAASFCSTPCKDGVLLYRTSFEIEHERQALKLIRGDYKTAAAGDADVEDILEAVR
jgi:hypothetical protein